MTNKPLVRNTTPPGLKEVQMVVADIIGAEPQTGMFYDPSTLAYEITLAYTLTSPARTLTITPTGSTWRAWVNGVLYTFTGAQTIQHAATQGLWFIYVDNTGTIAASQTAWNLLDTAPIALVYYDATTPDFWLFDERHTYLYPASSHEHDHFAIGTYVKNPATDFVIGGYALGTDTDAAVQWSTTSGTACDEDIEKLLNAISSGGPYQVMYKSGVNGYFVRSQVTLPYVYAAASYIQWNQFTGSTWQLTAMTSSNRLNYYVFATTGYDGTKQIMILPGQAQYSSLAAAQAESVTALNLTGFPALEFVPLYQITFHTLAGYSHNGKCEIEAVTKITSSRATLSLAAPTFTNPMTALGDIIAGDAGGAPTRVPGNASALQEVLVQTGTGSVSALPTWTNAPAISGANFAAATVTVGVISASGTPSSTTYLRGDGQWATPSGSGGGDMLTALVNAESAITGTASPTSFDTMYVCSGTSADYTVSLPTSLTGKKNQIMGFRMDPGLTKLVTVDAGAGHLIDGQQTRAMWASEVALLKVNTDETNWSKVAGKTISMSSSIGQTANQVPAYQTVTLANLNTSSNNYAPATMQTAASAKITALRPGLYQVLFKATITSNNASPTQVNIYIFKNGGQLRRQFSTFGAAYYGGETILDVLSLAAGDYIQPYLYYTSGTFVTTVLYPSVADTYLTVTEVPTW